MSQHGMNIANQSGLLFRSDLNNALGALVTDSSGNTEPTTTFAFQNWVDTSGPYPVLKKRNAANSAWLTVGRLDLDNYGLGAALASSTAPASPYAYQQWIDTSSGAILKIRNGANSAWITLGDVTATNFGLLAKAGGTMSAPILFSNTDYTSVPVGTTAQRPGSPAAGMIRYNSDLVAYEGHNGSAWSPIGGGGFTVTSVQSITAGGTINSSTVDQRQMRHVQGNAAAVSASVTPFGTGGGWKDGAEILLIGNSDANSVLLTYNDAANGLVGNFSTIELTLYRNVLVVWSSSLSRWILRG